MFEMFQFSVAVLPFIGIAILNFFGSWVYYSPISPFFKQWQLALGMDPNKRQMTEEDKKNMPRLFGGAIVSSFLLSYGLQFFVKNLLLETCSEGVIVGGVIWVAFAVTQSLNTQFEGRKPVVLVINNIWYLVTYALLGGLAAVWR